MDEQRYNRRDPWEPGKYETGRTQPPKSHRGLIAILLVVVIFLCGLVSALGVVNVKLFTQLNALSQPKEDPLSFINEEEENAANFPSEEPSAAEAPMATEISHGFSAGDSLILNPSPDSIPNVVQEGGMSLQDIYDKTIHSVVSISSHSREGGSTGTGVIISGKGYIVTNYHVIRDASSVTVLLHDDRSYSANIVGADEISDLAVLKIQAENLVSAEFGDSSVLRVGDSVAAIGNPLGEELRGTLTNGIVSAINRDVTSNGRTLTLIQTNAALNSGNSGGPLLNCYGQVIGINTLKIGAFTDEAGVEGLGFAIPSTTVKEIVEQLIHQGYVSGRPTLGITGEGLSSFYQYYYQMPAGLYITALEPGSPAERCGIEPGDLLISIDDHRITDEESYKTALYNYAIGDTVTVIIYRSGNQYSVSLTLHESTT